MDSVETTNCNSTEFEDEFEDQYLTIDQHEEYKQYQKELDHVSYNDIMNKEARAAVMVVSENQALINAVVSDKINNIDDIVRKVIPNLLVTKIANIQPMLRPSGQVFVKDKARNTIGHKIYAKTRMLNASITKEMSVDEIANLLIKEINEETIKDLHLELVSTVRTSCYKDFNEKEFKHEFSYKNMIMKLSNCSCGQ